MSPASAAAHARALSRCLFHLLRCGCGRRVARGEWPGRLAGLASAHALIHVSMHRASSVSGVMPLPSTVAWQQRGVRPRTERDSRDQCASTVVQLGPTELIGPLTEVHQSGDTVGDPTRAEVFPVFDLIDVATIDVPQLGRAAVVPPVVVGQLHSSVAHRARLRQACSTQFLRPRCRDATATS